MARFVLVALSSMFLAVAAGAAPPPAGEPAAAEPQEEATASAEEAVKGVVERFLVAIGSYDLEALPPMFAPHANIGAVRLRDGQWHGSTYTFDEFLAALKARTNPSPYQEPVSGFTVHVEAGGLAFVRADATLIRDGRPSSHNIDYFTLIEVDGSWKILSAAYVATPIADPEG